VVDEQEARRAWVARLAAPVAFFVAATVLIILVESGLNGGGSAATTSTLPAASNPTTTAGTTSGPKKKKRIYRVRRGDTLESIAAKFNTTVDDLLQLNPNVDPLALSPGQKIRVS
jgi:LysM repeat protein